LAYKIEHIHEDHIVKGFSCGLATVDSYIRNFARRNASSNLGQTYVLVEQGSPAVLGYFTLCSCGVATRDIPSQQRPPVKYPSIPASLIARLGVQQSHAGKGLGKLLLVHALTQCYLASQIMGINLVVVDANAKAKDFYLRFGFAELLDHPLHLYLPIKTVEPLVKSI